MLKYHKKPNIFVTEVVLKVQDLNRSLEFYKSIMGFKVLKSSENKVILTVDGINPIVTIIKPQDIIPKVQRKTGLYHFAVLLPDRLQLGLFLKNIKSQNYPLVGGSHHGVSEAIYLEDPDENGIEVYADTADISWDKNDYSVNMVTDRLDYNELEELTESRLWEGAPVGTIMGHIHLHVADLDESFKFYNALGFKLTQAMKHHAYFVSTGGYHHHIGLNIWSGKGASPPPENSVGMLYYTILFPDEYTKTEKISNLKSLGYEVIEENNEIFTKDPSKNLIRLQA